MVLRLVPVFRRAMDLSLVLDAEGIPHELRSVGEDQWALCYEDEHGERAEQALRAFERENPLGRAPPALETPLSSGIPAGLLFFLPLLAFFIWVGPESGNAWIQRGSAEAAAILRGEVFRAVTALTLHADAGHAVGNALLGGALLAWLARSLGGGVAGLVLLLSGALGTLSAAALVQRGFTSIGASTAVFGALGALSAGQAQDPSRRRRAWIPLGAGLALLGFLGTSKRADFAGHLCGFVAGALLGLLAAALPRLRSRWLQAALGLVALAVPALAWWAALR